MKCGACGDASRSLDEHGICLECNLETCGNNLVIPCGIMDLSTEFHRAIIWTLCSAGVNIFIGSPSLYAATHGRKTGWEVRSLSILSCILGMHHGDGR